MRGSAPPAEVTLTALDVRVLSDPPADANGEEGEAHRESIEPKLEASAADQDLQSPVAVANARVDVDVRCQADGSEAGLGAAQLGLSEGAEALSTAHRSG